jgi:hypothetical protein
LEESLDESEENESLAKSFIEQDVEGLTDIVSNIRQERDHWKSKYEALSKITKIDDSSSSDAYEKKLDKLSTTINMKVKVIEEICTQLFKLEQDHIQQRSLVEEFITTAKQELNSIKLANQSVVAQAKHEIEKHKFVIENKLADYHTIRLQMEQMIASNSDSETNSRLLEENDQLRSLVNSQKEMINELFRDRDLLKEETDREVDKWKGISSLTIPLVELLNRSMETNAKLSTPTVEQNAQDLHALVATPPLTMTDTADLKHESENGTTISVDENVFLDVTPVTPASPATPEMMSLKIVQTTIIGTSHAGHVDGYGKRACFNTPSAICLSVTSSALFVAECGNRCIRKINLQVIRIVI